MAEHPEDFDKQEKGKKRIIRKLRKHYRLVLMNDDNFEIKTSVKLSPLNVLLVVSTLFVIFAFIIISLIAFTPMKHYILGGRDKLEMRKELTERKLQLDSLHRQMDIQIRYITDIGNVLSGNLDTVKKELVTDPAKFDTIKLNSVSETDSLLRAEVENMQSYGILATKSRSASSIEELYFFPPLKGIVTSGYRDYDHPAVDVVAKENSAIKATLDGKVIFTGWTIDDGNVITLQHDYNLVSIYKHNSVILKKVGSFVKAGDVIAIIGDSGELSEGPHLHFELWHEMIPIDPLRYINFN